MITPKDFYCGLFWLSVLIFNALVAHVDTYQLIMMSLASLALLTLYWYHGVKEKYPNGKVSTDKNRKS